MKYIVKYYLRADDNTYDSGYKTKKSETDLTAKDLKDFLKAELKVDEKYTVESELLEATSHDVELIDSKVLAGREFQNYEYNIRLKKK
jgi:hypothetical protein